MKGQPQMATQEQKDRKIAAAQKRVGNIQKRIDAANERIATAQKVLEDQKTPLAEAKAILKWAQDMPVNGQVEPETPGQDATAEATAEAAPETVNQDQQPAFI